MAKKATKRPAAKRKSKTLRKVSDKTLEGILIECALAVGRGVGSAVTISDTARKYWHTDFRKSIKHALGSGEKWKDGRKLVLPLSTKMGAHAATLATSGVILKPAAVTAADAIKNDRACPSTQGKYCS